MPSFKIEKKCSGLCVTADITMESQHFDVWDPEEEGREGNGKNEGVNQTDGETKGAGQTPAGQMTKLSIPSQTAPFWDSNSFSFKLPMFLEHALGSLQECGYCLCLRLDRQPTFSTWLP